MTDIELDIKILEDLIRDVRYYKEIYESDTNSPQDSMVHQENYQFALDQFGNHKMYLLSRLEEWFDITLKEVDVPVNLRFYRILKELREQNKK